MVQCNLHPYPHATTLIVRCQVSQLESTLAKERSERAELMQRIEQLETRDEARLQHVAEQEKALGVQVGVKEK